MDDVSLCTRGMRNFTNETEARSGKYKLILSAIVIFMSGVFSSYFWWTGAGIVFLLNAFLCLICVLVAVGMIYQKNQSAFNSINQDETQPGSDK